MKKALFALGKIIFGGAGTQAGAVGAIAGGLMTLWGIYDILTLVGVIK